MGAGRRALGAGRWALGAELWALGAGRRALSFGLLSVICFKVYVMRDFKTLQIWESSHKLTLDVYELTASFPKEEVFGLTSQLRRSVASVPTNIAEGCGRNSDADTAHFIQIAIGSLCETEYHLILARDLGYIDNVSYESLSERITILRKQMIRYCEVLRLNKQKT